MSFGAIMWMWLLPLNIAYLISEGFIYVCFLNSVRAIISYVNRLLINGITVEGVANVKASPGI